MPLGRAPHPFTLRQLQYVVAIADEGGFRRAAAACRVAQPSLSTQVAAVEDALGARLFERRGRTVQPTAVGAEVIRRARRVLEEADALARDAVRLGDPFDATWRIGVIPTIAPYLLPAIARAIRERWPRLHPQWVEEKTSSLVALLDRGELDAAILARVPEVEALATEVLAEDPFVLAVPRGHPLATTELATERDLAGQPVLLLDDGHCFRAQALAVCGQAGADELDFRATSLPTLAQMVAGGAGITLLPALAVPTEAPRADLAVRPFRRPVPGRTVVLAWRPTSPLAAPLAAFAELVREAWPALG